MASAFIDLLNDVKAQAKEQITNMAFTVQTNITGPQGQAFGDVNVSAPDRIARFYDYATRGVLDALRGMGAPVYQMLIDEFVDDMRHYLGTSATVQPVGGSEQLRADIVTAIGGR